MSKNFGFDVLKHVGTAGTYPNLWSIACFGAAGATAGSCITVIACVFPLILESSSASSALRRGSTMLTRVCAGPFELTKLSAQVSVLLSEKTQCPDSQSHAVATSYQNKGTLKTMANIVRHRGLTGLYTGYRLHLCALLLCWGRCDVLKDEGLT